jgi:hypothetical protein
MPPWAWLAERVEGDLALAGEGRWEELARSLADRPAVLATIPDATPADRPWVERVHAAHTQVVAALALGRERAGREFATLRRGRQAMTGYVNSRGELRASFDRAG